MKIGKKRLSPWIGKSLLLCTFILALLSPYILVQIAVPDTVRVMDGESWGNDWFRMEVEETEWVTVNDTSIQKNQQIESSEIAETSGTIKLWGIIPLKTVSLEVWPEKTLLVGGCTVGIDLYTDGILVLGTGKVETQSGTENSSAKGLLFAGDRIRKVDGQVVSTVEEVDELVAKSAGREITLVVARNNTLVNVTVTPKIDIEGNSKIGIWIRDRAQGLGTLTFVDPQTNVFGAVGHGISDADTEKLLPINDGIITRAKIRRLVKGTAGSPGEIEGSLSSEIMGKITQNNDYGIYGTAEETIETQGSYEIALKNQVKNGNAVILSDVLGSVDSYSVTVQKASGLPTYNTGMVVTVTDERLLEATGGIIQGMSGCPIIQDGKLIGAVTHVFVKDSAKGYGVYIEDMLNAAEGAG